MRQFYDVTTNEQYESSDRDNKYRETGDDIPNDGGTDELGDDSDVEQHESVLKLPGHCEFNQEQT